MTSPPIADMHASFRRALRAAHKADRTIVLYGQSIRFFCDWLTAQGKPTTLDQLTRQNITTWLAELNQTVSVETTRTRLRGLRRFCRWLEAEGEVDKAATAGIEMPAPKDTPPPVLTTDQLKALLKLCARPRTRTGRFDQHIFDGRRDEVLIRVLADCGVRVSELAGLRLTDIDLDQEVLYVVGKGSRPRAVPFSAKTAQAIDRYLRMRSGHRYAQRTDRLLLSQRGAMSADGVRWRLEQLGGAAGIDHLHPHQLRHTAAHQWLASGGQERDLMMLMGWRSDAMLSVYARSTAVERAHSAHRRLGLGDQL